MKYIYTFILILFVSSVFGQIPTGYYDSATGLQGEELKAALHNIIDNHTVKTYDDVRYILDETDRDPNNPNNLILLYKGTSVSNVWDGGVTYNREHVWAKSHGFPDESNHAYSDLHHLRPADPSVNSSRNDKDFDNGGDQHSEATECYATSTTWEPRDAVKGDVARMMFYMATRYEGDVAGEPDLELVDHITSYPDPVFGVLSTLIEWNRQDPVDDFERNRNEVIFSYQGNRNPFIDHPEYVDYIYSYPVINNQSFDLTEHSSNTTEVGTILASDPQNDDLSFSILSGNTDNAFAINSDNGLLTVNNTNALDYDINPTFNLTIEVSDGSFQSNAIITINLEQTTGIISLSDNSNIKIYPNPFLNELKVTAPDDYLVEVYSIIGVQMISTSNKNINTQEWKAGVYFVVIKNEIGLTIKSEKILKR